MATAVKAVAESKQLHLADERIVPRVVPYDDVTLWKKNISAQDRLRIINSEDFPLRDVGEGHVNEDRSSPVARQLVELGSQLREAPERVLRFG